MGTTPDSPLSAVFQARLNDLFATRRARTEVVNNSTAARWMTEHGWPITASALSLLRTKPGQKPSLTTIEGLSAYFDISPALMLTSARLADLAAAATQSSPEVQEALAGVDGLPPADLLVVRAVVHQLVANRAPR